MCGGRALSRLGPAKGGRISRGQCCKGQRAETKGCVEHKSVPRRAEIREDFGAGRMWAFKRTRRATQLISCGAARLTRGVNFHYTDFQQGLTEKIDNTCETSWKSSEISQENQDDYSFPSGHSEIFP